MFVNTQMRFYRSLDPNTSDFFETELFVNNTFRTLVSIWRLLPVFFAALTIILHHWGLLYLVSGKAVGITTSSLLASEYRWLSKEGVLHYAQSKYEDKFFYMNENFKKNIYLIFDFSEQINFWLTLILFIHRFASLKNGLFPERKASIFYVRVQFGEKKNPNERICLSKCFSLVFAFPFARISGIDNSGTLSWSIGDRSLFSRYPHRYRLLPIHKPD